MCFNYIFCYIFCVLIVFFCIFTASNTFASLQPNTGYTPVQLFVPNLPVLSEMPHVTDTVTLQSQSVFHPRSPMSECSTTESVPERQPPSPLESVAEPSTPILKELLSPEYLPPTPTPPKTPQPPSPSSPVFDIDPLWSPPPPPPSTPEPNDTLREEIARLLVDLPQATDRSGMDTPPFSPDTPLSFESLDVTRDISDWDELSDISEVIDEVLDTSDNY